MIGVDVARVAKGALGMLITGGASDTGAFGRWRRRGSEDAAMATITTASVDLRITMASVDLGITTVLDGTAASFFTITAWASLTAARFDLLTFCAAWKRLIGVFVEFSLATTAKVDDGGLGHFAGGLEIGEEFVLMGNVGENATFVAFGRVTKIHDGIFCGIPEETCGGQP